MKLDPTKLAQVTARIDSLCERIDQWSVERMPPPLIVRRADKAFDESKHPRGPDGKFVEGEGAAAASAAEYLAQQAKAGKKANPNGMMQHLLLNGGITKAEIWETTKANFEMAPHLNNYVSAVLATMKKKGIEAPEPPKAKKGGDKPAAKKEAPKDDPGSEGKPADDDKATEFNDKEAAAFEKSIASTSVASDIQEHAGDLAYAAKQGFITAGQHDKLKKQLADKAKELAAEPAAKPGAESGGAKIPGHDGTATQTFMHGVATDTQLSQEAKLAQLEVEYAQLKAEPNKKYAAKLIKALGGAVPGEAPAAPAPPPPAASLPDPNNSVQDDMHDIAKSDMTPEQKINALTSMKGLGSDDEEYKDHVVNYLNATAPAPAPPAGAATLPKPQNTHQDDIYWMANTTTYSAAEKAKYIAEMKVSPQNEAYKAAALAAVGGAPAATPAAAPPPKPPMKHTQVLQDELADLKLKWKGILPVNKPPVDAIEQALDKALSMQTGDEQAQALSQITPIASPVGMGQQSANAFLAKVQQEAGIAPTTPGHPVNAPLTKSLPKGAGKKLQSAIFKALHDSPANFHDGVYKLDGANGKIRARMKLDTDRIPKDQYAKITAAYGEDRDNGMTQAVDQAMLAYQEHSFGKLDAATQAAVVSYQGTGYGGMNGALLAGSEGEGKTKQNIQLIKKAIENSVIPADTPAFRGMRCSLKDLSGFDDPQKAVGRAFVHKNFASISRSVDTARNFGDQVMLKMTMPAGTPGLVMKKQGWEREIMLNANSVFRIDKVEQMANASGDKAKHMIHVTYMGTKEDA